MNWGKKNPNKAEKTVQLPILKVKTTRSWESFAIGLIIGMTFAFIMFSVGYYTFYKYTIEAFLGKKKRRSQGEFDATWVNVE